MRFPSLPLPLPLFSLSLLLLSPPPTTAQFTFPPPLTNGSLSSYLSGTLPSTLNVSAGDTLFGGWSTPGRLMSFLVYRCTGSTSPSATIEPLRGEEFNSSTGRAYPDKTWAQMPLYSSAASNFGNGFNPGRNPVWLAGEFFANNETTGALCWFELYPGTDTLQASESAYGESVRVVEVDGDEAWYFATEPFTVHPARPNNLTVTWRSSGPKPDVFKNHTQAYMAEFYAQFPELKTEGAGKGGRTSAAWRVLGEGPGWLGCVAVMVALAL